MDKTRKAKLVAYQEKLSALKFLDPACGSGNFLTETYLSLRRLENEVLSTLSHGQIAFGDANINPIEVSIGQFYGIEINDFAVTVAKTAMWIAESQMLKETEDVVHMNLDFLPLKSYANIHEGNALQVDWETVVPKHELNYIMGNPPFVGLSLRTAEQQEDMKNVFSDNDRAGRLDYVAAWYKKACEYSESTAIECAFVSTNSITQGEQVPILWDDLIMQHGIIINYAYRTFTWNNESKGKAAVFCVIIGFSHIPRKTKQIFTYNNIGKTKIAQDVDYINGYLVN
ncbi:MAG: DNA methyltransferase, partial [Oscillospiraceae bacterium]